MTLWDRLLPVLRRKGLTSSDKLVALGLCRFADKKGFCWPSVQALSDLTGLSARQVRRGLDELVRAGAIARISRYTKDGRQRSNLYRFLSNGGRVTGCPQNRSPESEKGYSEKGTGCQGEGDSLSGGGCQDDRGEGDILSGTGVTTCHPELSHKELIQKEGEGLVQNLSSGTSKPCSGTGDGSGPTAAILMRLFASRCPGLAVPGKVTKRREETVRQAIRGSPERHSIGWWEEVFDRVARSGFLNGGGSRGWKADYDWIMRQENLEKLLAGLYDDNSSSRPKGGTETLEEYVARMVKEVGLDGTETDEAADAVD